MDKIIFIADGYPLGTNAGSILYQKFLKSYGIDKFCYYAVGYNVNLEWPKEYILMPKQSSCLRIWPKLKSLKYLKIIPLIEELCYFISIPFISRKVEKFIKANNATLVIAVFRADVLAIINSITERNKLPLLGFISDTVEAEYSDKQLIFNFKKKEYLKAIKKSVGLYVAGESMDIYIKETYIKDTSILRLGYDPYINLNRTTIENSKEVRVFFSGSVYAKKEFELFIKALALFAFKHPTFKVKLIIASTYKIISTPENVQIINLGWVAENDLIKMMQDAHIGYVPYKFDKRSITQMTYAFPNKTGFYLSTGLPIFFHGPVYSSMSAFFEKYKCGIHCQSMNVEEICLDLENLLLDYSFYTKCINESIIAFKKEFSIMVFRNRVSSLIETANSKRNNESFS